MRRLPRPWLLLLALAALFVSAPALRAAPAAQSDIIEEEFSVTLGDGWVSRGKLTYPAGQAGPFPTVLLVPNPDADMDFLAPPGIVDPIYKDLAEYLTARGVAVARYNPRYVTGPGEFDQEKLFALLPPDWLADADAVLASVMANPRVDRGRSFVFGWSTSSLTAAALAARHPELRGLALVGPITTTDRQFFIEDYTEVALPYLITFAPDGRITPDVLQAALDGDGGLFAIGLTYAFTDPEVTDRIAVNPFFDKDGDGVLDVGAEILPNLGAWVDQDTVIAEILRGLPNVYEQAANLRPAVLVLQAENDAATRARNTLGLREAFADHPDFTLKLYPGLGHSLAPASSPSYDRPTFYSEQPKADLAGWILARSTLPASDTPSTAPTMPATLPNTGSVGLDPAWLAGVALGFLLAGAIVRRGRHPARGANRE